jgi:glucose-6-phosphate isomerase
MKIKVLPDVSLSPKVSFSAKHPMFQYFVPEVPPALRARFAAAKNVVVIGIGGSTLPLKVFVDACDLNDRVHIVDTVDSTRWREVKNLENPLFCVVSKSGETLEIKTLIAELVEMNALDRTLTITDPQSGTLRKWTSEKKLDSLEIPSNIGGRFTNFTIFHRAVLERFGFDFQKVLARAKSTCEKFKKDPSILEKLFHQTFESSKETQVLWAYGKKLEGLAYWSQQAIAESLGKKSGSGKRHGIFPVVLKGPQDQHSVLQLLTDGPQRNCLWFFIPEPTTANVERSLDAPLEALRHVSSDRVLDILAESTIRTFEERLTSKETFQPIATFTCGDLEDVGEAVATIQAFIEYAGDRLQINAFDQPGVERGKQIAREILNSI